MRNILFGAVAVLALVGLSGGAMAGAPGAGNTTLVFKPAVQTVTVNPVKVVPLLTPIPVVAPTISPASAPKLPALVVPVAPAPKPVLVTPPLLVRR